MAHDEGSSGGGTEMWHIVLGILVLAAIAGYMLYQKQKNPSWHPYDLDSSATPNIETINIQQ